MYYGLYEHVARRIEDIVFISTFATLGFIDIVLDKVIGKPHHKLHRR
jgi:hypothetical protein